MIRKNPELSHKALGEALAVSAATIKRTLTKMQHEGKVIREGSNRKGKWILTDKNRWKTGSRRLRSMRYKSALAVFRRLFIPSCRRGSSPNQKEETE